MKANMKVSISGIAFTLTPEAYDIIRTYLDRIREGFAGTPDGREIAADIEARLAEILLDGQDADDTVDAERARSAVGQLGYPDGMASGDDSAKADIPRRLYRNPEGARIGGVCSGLAAFFRTDPVWLRLLFAMPLPMVMLCGLLNLMPACEFFALLIPISLLGYLFLWVIIPKARTPRQKLEMHGEPVTASNIRQRAVDDAAAMPATGTRKRQAAGVWAELLYFVGRFLTILFKIIVAMILICIIAALLAAFVLLLDLLVTGGVSWIEALEVPVDAIDADTLARLAGASAALVLLTAFLFIYLLVRLFMGRRCSGTPLIIAGSLWILLAVYLSVAAAHDLPEIRRSIERHAVPGKVDSLRIRTVIPAPDKQRDDPDEWEDLEDFVEEAAESPGVSIDIVRGDGHTLIEKTVVDPASPGDTLFRARIDVGR